MHFDIYDLIVIETIENCGSFSKAADHLCRTRSAITQHIKKIEEQLDFQLFDRSLYRPSLTHTGKLFLERVRPLLRNWEHLKTEIQNIKQGWESEFSIVIDDILSVEPLLSVVEAFQKVAPFVTICIQREVLNGCWDALIENRATLVIGATGEPPIDLICSQRSMGTIPFVFAVSARHPLTRLAHPVTLTDLEAHPTILVSDTSQSLQKRSSGIIAHQQRIIVPTIEDKIRAQIQGIGIGYLPLPRIKPFLKTGELVELTLLNQPPKKPVFKMAWRPESHSTILQWFLNYLQSPSLLKKLIS